MCLAAAGECDVYRLIVGIIPVPVYQPSGSVKVLFVCERKYYCLCISIRGKHNDSYRQRLAAECNTCCYV